MIYLLILSIGLYSLLILSFVIGFQKIPVFHTKKVRPTHAFSIVIAFRNERKNLSQLLQSIAEIKYPAELFEILLVNHACVFGILDALIDTQPLSECPAFVIFGQP